jgi:predicted ATPase/DNA-binding NarL/FixJ family response regulator
MITLQKGSSMSHGLPLQLTTFIGRAQELAELTALLAAPECRLLTLVGPGGIGKTRLALQVAKRLGDADAASVCFVDLQPLAEPQFLPVAIAQALEVILNGQEEAEVQLIQYLRSMEVLLVLDNFDHLLEGAGLLIRILVDAPHVKCLVTSRSALDLQGEWRFPVDGLDYGGRSHAEHIFDPEIVAESVAESDALRLFAERARRVYRSLDLAAALPDIAQVCRQLEGMPLAIELAATWTKSLSCAAIAAELRGSLDFLATSARDVPARHRSMRAALDSSWQRLSPAEQSALQALSVFRGGFQRDAAEQVAGATLATLTALVNHSLLRWDARGRYAIHELVRQYAAAKLAEDSETEARIGDMHCHYYAAFLDARAAAVCGANQHATLREIESEFDNIRATWEHALARHDLLALHRIVYPFYEFADFQGFYREANSLFGRAIAVLEEGEGAHLTLALVLTFQGWIYMRLGDLGLSWDAFERSAAFIAELGNAPPAGFGTDPHNGLGLVAHIRGDYDLAVTEAEAVRARCEADADWLNLQIALYVLANATLAQGDLAAAAAHAQHCLTVIEATGNRLLLGNLWIVIGEIAQARGSLAEAQAAYHQSYAIQTENSDPGGAALALDRLGRAAWQTGDLVAAEEYHRQSHDRYIRLNDQGGVATSLLGLGNVAAAHGDGRTTAAYYREAITTARAMSFGRLVVLLLTDGATLLAQAGEAALAAELATWVLADPACDYECRRRAQALLVNLAPNQAANLESLITRLLAALDALPSVTVVPARVNKPSSLVEPLTPREQEVLRLLAQGCSNPEIGATLIVSVGTVKFHTAQIFGKLAVHNRTQAVNRARELGLI